MKNNKKINLLAIAIFSITIISCSDDNDTTEVMTEARFQAEFVGDMDQEILIDNETDLVWINDVRGCFAAIVNPTTECAELTFAGQSDWRVPTADEMAELLTEIAEREMNLNYINVNCPLMSTSDTIWVFTENTDTPGLMTMNQPGNAGLRCVRAN